MGPECCGRIGANAPTVEKARAEKGVKILNAVLSLASLVPNFAICGLLGGLLTGVIHDLAAPARSHRQSPLTT